MGTRRVILPPGLGAWVSIVGGGVMAVGPLLPWLTASGVFTSSFNGLRAAGVGGARNDAGPVFVVFGVMAMVLGAVYLGRRGSAGQVGAFISAIGVLAIVPAVLGWQAIHGPVYFVKIVERLGSGQVATTQPIEVASIGVGYLLCLIGLIIVSAGGLALLSATKPRATLTPADRGAHRQALWRERRQARLTAPRCADDDR